MKVTSEENEKGNVDWGAKGKVLVFGLYQRKGYVYAVSVVNTRGCTLFPIINAKVKPHSIVYTDTYPPYNVLDASHFRHKRIHHTKEYARDTIHINGIENFLPAGKKNTCPL